MRIFYFLFFFLSFNETVNFVVGKPAISFLLIGTYKKADMCDITRADFVRVIKKKTLN